MIYQPSKTILLFLLYLSGSLAFSLLHVYNCLNYLLTGEDGKSTDLTYLVHSDIGGWVPVSLVNKGTVTTLWTIMHKLPEAVVMVY
jgi:hypothetical protein